MSVSRRLADRAGTFSGAVALLLVGTLAGSALLLRFPPDAYSFYPRCPIATYLHLQCPGCGTTRAFAALLHGHIAAALRLNSLTTVLLPVAVLYGIRHLWLQRNAPALTLPHPPRFAIYVLLLCAAIFAVMRNVMA